MQLSTVHRPPVVHTCNLLFFIFDFFSETLRKHWIDFDETWQTKSHERALLSLCFRVIGQQRRSPLTLICWDFSTSPHRQPPWHRIDWDVFVISSATTERNFKKSKQVLNVWSNNFYSTKMVSLSSDRLRHFRPLHFPQSGIRQNWTGDKTSTYKVCVLVRSDTKTASWPNCWDIFQFSSATAERRFTRLDRKSSMVSLPRLRFFFLLIPSTMVANGTKVHYIRSFWVLLRFVKQFSVSIIIFALFRCNVCKTVFNCTPTQ